MCRFVILIFGFIFSCASFSAENLAAFSDSQGNIDLNITTPSVYQFDTVDVASPNIQLIANSKIQVAQAGFYQVTYSVNWQTTNNSRRQIRTELLKNGFESISASVAYGYTRNVDQAGSTTNSATSYIELAANDYVELIYQRNSSVGGAATTIANEVTVSVEYLPAVALGAGTIEAKSIVPWSDSVQIPTIEFSKSIKQAEMLNTDEALLLYTDGTVEYLPGVNPINTNISNIPVGLANVVQIDMNAGGTHRNAFALLDDGTVVNWGVGSASSGGGLTNDVPSDLSGVTQISIGLGHGLALKDDGSIVAWGDNFFGQATVPANLTNVVQVSAGTNHSLALLNDGTVVAFGSSSNSVSTVPARLTNVVKVVAGRLTSVALKDDGTVVPWGNTAFINNIQPHGGDLTQIKDIVYVSDRTYLGVKENGSVVVWGLRSGDYRDKPLDIGFPNTIYGNGLSVMAVVQ